MRVFYYFFPLCLVLSSCFPPTESPRDEERNPFYATGKARSAARDFKGAVEAFEKAVEVNPRSALAHFELGLLYEQSENDYAAALYHYNRVGKLRPNGDYPAENAKARIPGCRQELIKADAAATINPAILRETETLRGENAQLKRGIEQLRVQLTLRPAAFTNTIYVTNNNLTAIPSRGSARPESVRNLVSLPEVSRPAAAGKVRPNSIPAGAGPASASRIHTVKNGETFASIARQHGVRIEGLISLNPALDPKRLRVGQTLNLPALP